MTQTPIDLTAITDPNRKPLRVLLVTTWQEACGIAEHSRLLKEAVEKADPFIEVLPTSELLDPNGWEEKYFRYDLLHLNYHAALHSRWTGNEIAGLDNEGMQTLVTYHDTGVPNSDQCKSIIAAAAAAVVHEPFDDLPADKTYYWCMGVPELAHASHYYSTTMLARPLLGTVGFPFGWKNYDELARVTAEVGWGLVLLAPTATSEQIERWTAINPHTTVEPLFIKGPEVLARLNACDATAFCYVCHNTGQSGAILQGIGARKPVIALSTCRQFRALYNDELGHRAIRWCQTFEDVAESLMWMALGRVDAPTVALAEQDSWRHLGKKYAALYRQLAGTR